MVVAITGANRGIGLELARVYKEKGYEVWALCRHTSSEIEAIADQLIVDFDVTQPVQIERGVKSLAGKKLDILINNAGLLIADSFEDFQGENLIEQFEVNALGPLRVTRALYPCLHAGSKVAMVTSRMGSVADNSSGGYYGYRASKAALNSIAKSLALDFRSESIAVGVFHPGFVKTQMTGLNGEIEPETAAQRLYDRIESLSLKESGGFWHSNGEPLPW